jgi:ribosomal protein S24E
MYKNVITSENTPDSHKAVIVNQVDGQLAEVADSETEAVQVERLKEHFTWLLANDFYKDELSAEQIAEMENYLPSDYQDEYQDLPI